MLLQLLVNLYGTLQYYQTEGDFYVLHCSTTTSVWRHYRRGYSSGRYGRRKAQRAREVGHGDDTRQAQTGWDARACRRYGWTNECEDAKSAWVGVDVCCEGWWLVHGRRCPNSRCSASHVCLFIHDMDKHLNAQWLGQPFVCARPTNDDYPWTTSLKAASINRKPQRHWHHQSTPSTIINSSFCSSGMVIVPSPLP